MRDTRNHPTLPRDRLIALIPSRPEPVLVLEAAAAMGKSTLLTEIAKRSGQPVHIGETAPDVLAEARALWDIPPGANPQPLPERFVSGLARILIAKRPETVLPGLARAGTYGRSAVFATDDFLFTRDGARRALPRRHAGAGDGRDGRVAASRRAIRQHAR